MRRDGISSWRKNSCDIVYRNRGSRYHRSRHEKLHKKDVASCLVSRRPVSSRCDSREFTRNDRVINNLRTHLSRITSSISVPPSEVENIFFPSFGASLPPSRDMSNRKVQEVCQDFSASAFPALFRHPCHPVRTFNSSLL